MKPKSCVSGHIRATFRETKEREREKTDRERAEEERAEKRQTYSGRKMNADSQSRRRKRARKRGEKLGYTERRAEGRKREIGADGIDGRESCHE